MSRKPLEMAVPQSLVDEATRRARQQESVYGHNTGHFSLSVEKENTVTGTLGELLAKQVVLEVAAKLQHVVQVELATLGAPNDLSVSVGGVQGGIHVKTGLWRAWPKPTFAFGIHADQGIEKSASPLILVSLIRTENPTPFRARIEGYVRPRYLKNCQVINKGERFPVTGVVSRTQNIVTYIGDYEAIDTIFDENGGMQEA